MVFTGSGDSHACSLFAHYFSDGLACAADPYELELSPESCRGKTVFIISVSGRTRANVRFARRIRRLARKSIAITSNSAGPLSKACDDTIRIPYNIPAAITPGTLSFTLCLLAVASTVERIQALGDLAEGDARAKRWAQSLTIIPRGSFLFTGSGVGYALSAYGAFKIQEVLGQPADYVHTEQLAHSKIFSVGKADNMVCFAPPLDRKTLHLSETLSKNGFRAHLLTSESRNPLVAGLEAAFAFQHLAITLARKRGLREVSFLADRKKLRLSSRLIY
jgi:DNA-binding MurR/RpiR family transcriptional regulator